MQLHTIGSSNKKSRRRVGRGGKRGTTSGHGTKGQKSRSGHRIRPAERDLIQRLPKMRGHRNLAKSEKLPIINVGGLKHVLKQGSIVSEESLGGRFKILGGGTVDMALTVRDLPVSKDAKKKIVAAGGTVE